MPDLNKWVDVEATQAVSRHTSAGIFAIVCFGLLWLFVHYILPHSWVQLWIETIDEFILVGLFLLLGVDVLLFFVRRIRASHWLLLAA